MDRTKKKYLQDMKADPPIGQHVQVNASDKHDYRRLGHNFII